MRWLGALAKDFCHTHATVRHRDGDSWHSFRGRLFHGINNIRGPVAHSPPLPSPISAKDYERRNNLANQHTSRFTVLAPSPGLRTLVATIFDGPGESVEAINEVRQRSRHREALLTLEMDVLAIALLHENGTCGKHGNPFGQAEKRQRGREGSLLSLCAASRELFTLEIWLSGP